jgi:hypothetical protein
VWQKERVVVTREMIAFTDPGDEDIIDRIFLSEVDRVQDMAKFNQGVEAATFSSVIMIATAQAGFNNGRTYYIQAETEEDCTEIATKISHLVTIATRKAEAENIFAQFRMFCRQVFHSPYFQAASALLIIAVSQPRATSRANHPMCN